MSTPKIKDWAKMSGAMNAATGRPAEHSDPGELAKYLAALADQAKAEASKDLEGARKAAHKASSIFFVMSPADQTIASRAARAKGLA